VKMMFQALACSWASTFHKIVVGLENSMEEASAWKESIPSHYLPHRRHRKSKIAVKVVLPYTGHSHEGRMRG